VRAEGEGFEPSSDRNGPKRFSRQARRVPESASLRAVFNQRSPPRDRFEIGSFESFERRLWESRTQEAIVEQ
jgi:hypothetical protein